MAPQSPGIEPNMPQDLGARTTQATGQVGRFDSVYDSLSYTAAIAGPVATATAQTYRPQSADIVNAAVSATAGYGFDVPGAYSGGAASYGMVAGRGPAGLVTPGHMGMQTTPGGSSSDGVLQQSQQILADSQASSIAMLIVQDEMGQQNRMYTSTSNLMNSRDTMLSSIIRNVRVG